MNLTLSERTKHSKVYDRISPILISPILIQLINFRRRRIFFHCFLIVPVGNIQIRTASGWTGGLEPPDFVVTDMQRVSGPVPHCQILTPIGVSERGLDSALNNERPRAPALCCGELW